MKIQNFTPTQTLTRKAAPPAQPQTLDVFEGGFRDASRTMGISTLVGAAVGAAAVGFATSGMSGGAGMAVGGLGGGLTAASVVGIGTGAVAAHFTHGDGWSKLGSFMVGAMAGGAVGGIAGAIGGAMVGTGAGNALGFAAGAFAGGTIGYFVGKGIAR
ncbi:MAG: hypothetical protein AB7S38_41050 [Vulcanimicrobiota bacterium]